MSNKQPDKVPVVSESSKDNGGKRTVIQSTLAGGSSLPPHYHDLFEETFQVVEREITVWNGDSKVTLRSGQSSTIKRTVVHSYKVESDRAAQLKVILEPGQSDFEDAMKIMIGLQNDGKYSQVSKLTWDSFPVIAAISELSNVNHVGAARMMFRILSVLHGRKKLQRVKRELIEKYCRWPGLRHARDITFGDSKVRSTTRPAAAAGGVGRSRLTRCCTGPDAAARSGSRIDKLPGCRRAGELVR